MSKSIIKDLFRDANFRYFLNIGNRIKYIGFRGTFKEMREYYDLYASFPVRIGNQKPGWRYKLFVIYNYFKIVAVHNRISRNNLLNYIPTRLQKYFIYELDPKDKREITFNKILFYRVLEEHSFPFPKVFFYTSGEMKIKLNGDEFDASIEELPTHLFVKPVKDNGGSNARVIQRSEISKLQDELLVQELAINHNDLIGLAGSFAFNTVRIITYLDNCNNVNILSAILRLSLGKQVDNWGKGSINVSVDIETGSLGKIGITKRNKRYLQHPSGTIPFEGFKLPHWESFVAVVKDGCNTMDYLRFIAWDIGIDHTGPMIVEANAGCDFFHAQLFKPYGNTVLINDLLDI